MQVTELVPAEHIVTAPDGVRLFVRQFSPSEFASDRTLVIVHGASEHGARYARVAEMAVQFGWNVVIPDLRGHGRSGGTPVHVDSFQQYLDDLGQIFARFELLPDRTALLGHSMGGLVAVRFAETRPDRLAGLVTIAPLLGIGVPVPRLKLLAGRLMSRLAPRTRFRLDIDPSALTHDPDCLLRRATDPLMHWSVTARWYVEVTAAIELAQASAASIRIPVLLLLGDAERVVSPVAVQRWFRAVESPDKTVQVLADHLHELLNEPDWEQTARTVLEWMDVTLAASPISS